MERAKTIVADFFGRKPVRLPRDTEDLARPQRRDDDRAGFDARSFRHAIIERAKRGIQRNDAGAGEGHLTVIAGSGWQRNVEMM
jgi:hypothetical protein